MAEENGGTLDRAGELVKGPLARASLFLKEVRIELRKVTWPPRKETVASTWVVLAVVILFSVYFFVLDLGIARMVKFLLSAGASV